MISAARSTTCRRFRRSLPDVGPDRIRHGPGTSSSSAPISSFDHCSRMNDPAGANDRVRRYAFSISRQSAAVPALATRSAGSPRPDLDSSHSERPAVNSPPGMPDAVVAGNRLQPCYHGARHETRNWGYPHRVKLLGLAGHQPAIEQRTVGRSEPSIGRNTVLNHRTGDRFDCESTSCTRNADDGNPGWEAPAQEGHDRIT